MFSLALISAIHDGEVDTGAGSRRVRVTCQNQRGCWASWKKADEVELLRGNEWEAAGRQQRTKEMARMLRTSNPRKISV